MFAWSVLLTGPVMLPLALLLRSDVSEIAAEAMLVAGVLGLFLAICATEALGTTPARSKVE